MKKTAGVTEQKPRETCTAAFKDLRDNFRAIQEKHGLAKPKAARS